MCRADSKKALSVAQSIFDFLQKSGEVFVEGHIANDVKTKGYNIKEINRQADIVITIGGDGTIIRAVKEVEKPVFSINSGGMGFLAEVESKYALEGLQRIIDGSYNIEERSKLKVILDGNRLPDALNEVTVQTDRIAKILYLKIFIDDELVETMGADGIIIATPTGSTSYALSVGGPILDPAVNAMVIAPLAPFKLSARPWIVPMQRKIGVKLLSKSKESKIVIDGSYSTSVNPDSDIMITISEKKAKFIRFGETFYQMVRLKLMR
ncbi:MAG: NAD(+)/NADH kinase [Thermoplasmatota archaeon]